MDESHNIIDTLRDIEYYVKIVIIILILLLNGTVVVTFMRMRKPLKRCTSNILHLNQALADITVCIPLMKELLPMHIYFQIWEHALAFVWFTIFVSLGSILLNAFDKFINTKNPTHRLSMKTNKGVIIAISSVWLLSAIPAVATAVTIATVKPYWIGVRTLRLTLFIIALTMVAVVIALLLFTIRLLRKKKRTHCSADQSLDQREAIKRHRMVKILLAMVLVHTLTSSPIIIRELVTHAHYKHMSWLHMFVAWLITYFLYTLRAVINPLCTLLLVHDYRYVVTAHACCGRTGHETLLEEEGEEAGDCVYVTMSMNEIEEDIPE